MIHSQSEELHKIKGFLKLRSPEPEKAKWRYPARVYHTFSLESQNEKREWIKKMQLSLVKNQGERKRNMTNWGQNELVRVSGPTDMSEGIER